MAFKRGHRYGYPLEFQILCELFVLELDIEHGLKISGALDTNNSADTRVSNLHLQLGCPYNKFRL